MTSFTDRLGRTWTLDADFSLYEKIRHTTGVDLTDIATPARKSLEQLGDPYTLGAVLWLFCEEQAGKIGLEPEDFRKGFNGEVLELAGNALMDEMIFFCRPSMREILSKTAKKVREAEQKAAKAIAENQKGLDEAIEAAVTSVLGDLAMSSQESSASTPEAGA